MKRIVTILLVVAMALSAVFALVACDGNKSEVEKAIDAAKKMTLAELEAASKAEMEANPTAVFNADSLTSGIKKALGNDAGVDKDGKEIKAAGFIGKYDWITDANAKYNSKKGSEYQPKLNAAAETNQYIADFVMIQDAAFVNTLASDKFLLSYVPSGNEFKFDKADTAPMVGVSFNKVFMYNNSSVGKDQLKNVWQMTDVAPKAGSTLKNNLKVSYQSPLAEDINMNFLIMMTSPDACKKLTEAYKSYTGKDYAKNKDYQNIGYEFVARFLNNIQKNGVWHGSDSTEIKELNNEDKRDGRIVLAGLCKLKDYPGYKVDTTNPAYYKTVCTAAGWNNDVEGFPGFVYNMWTLIPSTAKLPYTACLFVRYLLTEEGYNAGWGNILGYYSANQNIASVEGDPALATWKTKAIVEDVSYINKNYTTVKAFINQQMTGKGPQK